MATMITPTTKVSDNGYYEAEGVRLSNDENETYGWLDTWNKSGFKSVSVDNAADTVSFYNFVEVNINNTNTDGATIYLGNVKRADITTSDGDDSIFATISTNKLSWSNLFQADTGAGNDHIELMNSLDSNYAIDNSKYTSIDIDAGTGDDYVSVLRISEAYNESVTRHIDGGEGLDVLALGANTTVEFENFEVVLGLSSSKPTTISIDETNLVEGEVVLFENILLQSDVDAFSGFDISATLDSSDVSWGAEADQLIAEYGDSTEYAYFELTNGTDTYYVVTDTLDFISDDIAVA